MTNTNAAEPNISEMDDTEFEQFLAQRSDGQRSEAPATPLDDDDESSGQDDAWSRSPWSKYSPDDVDRQIEANRRVSTHDTEPEPIDVSEVPDDLFEKLERLGTGRGTGQDRRAIREAGLSSLVAEEYR